MGIIDVVQTKLLLLSQ